MTNDERLRVLAARVQDLSEQLETTSTACRTVDKLLDRLADTEQRLAKAERIARENERIAATAVHAHDDELRAEYRRGYGAGFHSGRRNGNRDADQVKRRRRPTTIIPTLDAPDRA